MRVGVHQLQDHQRVVVEVELDDDGRQRARRPIRAGRDDVRDIRELACRSGAGREHKREKRTWLLRDSDVLSIVGWDAAAGEGGGEGSDGGMRAGPAAAGQAGKGEGAAAKVNKAAKARKAVRVAVQRASGARNRASARRSHERRNVRKARGDDGVEMWKRESRERGLGRSITCARLVNKGCKHPLLI